MSEPLSLSYTAARLSTVASALSAALADEGTDPIAPLAHLDRVLDLVEVLSWGLCRSPATFPVAGLREIALSLTGDQAPDLSREHGELTGGQPAWQFADQVARVVLGAAVLAEVSGVDLDAAIGRQAAAMRAGNTVAALVPGGSGE